MALCYGRGAAFGVPLLTGGVHVAPSRYTGNATG